MPPTWLRDLLREREERVDPEEYAMSLFYVRRDDERYEEYRRRLDRDDR
jgi:hypothetical protein